MDEDGPGLAKTYDQIDEPARTAMAIKNLADNSSFLELMHRYETRFSRQYDRALRRLLDLQGRRNRQPPPPQKDKSILQNEIPAPAAAQNRPNAPLHRDNPPPDNPPPDNPPPSPGRNEADPHAPVSLQPAPSAEPPDEPENRYFIVLKMRESSS